MILGGNREISGAYVIGIINKWEEIKTDPVLPIAPDRKHVLRGSSKDPCRLVEQQINRG